MRLGCCISAVFFAIFRTLAICVLIELLDFKWKDSTPEQHAAFADLVVKCLLKPTKALDVNIRVGLQKCLMCTLPGTAFQASAQCCECFEAMGCDSE